WILCQCQVMATQQRRRVRFILKKTWEFPWAAKMSLLLKISWTQDLRCFMFTTFFWAGERDRFASRPCWKSRASRSTPARSIHWDSRYQTSLSSDSVWIMRSGIAIFPIFVFEMKDDFG